MITKEYKVTFEFPLHIWKKFNGTNSYASLIYDSVQKNLDCGRFSNTEWAIFETLEDAIEAENSLILMVENFKLQLEGKLLNEK